MADQIPIVNGVNTAVTDELVDEAFGASVHATSYAALTAAGLVGVARIGLSDGRTVVLKVGPFPAIRLLTFETGLISAEARCLTVTGPDALPGSPFARLLASGGGGESSEWMFTTFLRGEQLSSLEGLRLDSDTLQEELGAAMAQVHTLESPTGRFGYDAGRPSGADWPEAFAAIIASLLADAAKWQVKLPLPDEAIAELVQRHRDDLSEADRPAPVHFDLRKRNVLYPPGRTTPGSTAPDATH